MKVITGPGTGRKDLTKDSYQVQIRPTQPADTIAKPPEIVAKRDLSMTAHASRPENGAQRYLLGDANKVKVVTRVTD
jgi:hypothetical protein